jgi:hypothetical protein
MPLSPSATGFPVEVTFLTNGGATLGRRNAVLLLGKTETVSLPLGGGRTLTADLTITAGTKAGCQHIDVIMRDNNIDASGHFNKTVWHSASDPCGSVIMTLGPNEETQLRINLKPES